MGERTRSTRDSGTTRAHRRGGLAVLLLAAALFGGCATGRSGAVVTVDPVADTGEPKGGAGQAVMDAAGDVGRAVADTAGDVGQAVADTAGDVGQAVGESADDQHAWVSRKLGGVVDAVDKVFGEPRVEDRLRIVKARLTGKAAFESGEPADYGLNLNFRIPLPALQRRTHLFLEYSSDTVVDNLGGVNTIQNAAAATHDTESTLAAAFVRSFTDTFDLVGKVAYHGLKDYGPEGSIRYEKQWAPWMLFAEQEVYWRTARHWGGKTGVSLTYELSRVSFLRVLSEAKYYQDQRGTDLTTGGSYRRPFFFGSVISADAGVQYNVYDGDPKEEDVTDPEEDGDQLIARLRVVGKVWRDWIEWEVTPGYNYLWQHEDPNVWRLDLRLTISYEKALSGPR